MFGFLKKQSKKPKPLTLNMFIPGLIQYSTMQRVGMVSREDISHLLKYTFDQLGYKLSSEKWDCITTIVEADDSKMVLAKIFWGGE